MALFRKKSRRKRTPATPGLGSDYEHLEQVAFFNAIEMINHPAVEMTAAIPNQAVAKIRSFPARDRFYREGVKGGLPDIYVDEPTERYHGLRIEMKRPGEKPTEKQLEWHRRLRARGFRVEVCYSAADALAVWCDTYGIKVVIR